MSTAEEEPILVDEDPMVAEMARLADASTGKKKQRENAAAAEKTAADEAMRQAELELKRRELDMKRDEAIHRQHLQNEKMRIEHMKTLGRAAKVGAEQRAAQAADAIEDNAAARDDAIRKVKMLQEECGARGSGKRLTMDTPLPMLLAELELCNAQLNLERAREMPEKLLFNTMQTLESSVAAAGIANFTGTTARCQEAMEASRAAPPGSLDSHLHIAMRQASINYSHLFSARPEWFVLGTFAKIAAEQKAANDAVAERQADVQLSRELEEKLAKFD